jgi:hypothetical protein
MRQNQTPPLRQLRHFRLLYRFTNAPINFPSILIDFINKHRRTLDSVSVPIDATGNNFVFRWSVHRGSDTLTQLEPFMTNRTSGEWLRRFLASLASSSPSLEQLTISSAGTFFGRDVGEHFKILPSLKVLRVGDWRNRGGDGTINCGGYRKVCVALLSFFRTNNYRMFLSSFMRYHNLSRNCTLKSTAMGLYSGITRISSHYVTCTRRSSPTCFVCMPLIYISGLTAFRNDAERMFQQKPCFIDASHTTLTMEIVGRWLGYPFWTMYTIILSRYFTHLYHNLPLSSIETGSGYEGKDYGYIKRQKEWLSGYTFEGNDTLNWPGFHDRIANYPLFRSLY